MTAEDRTRDTSSTADSKISIVTLSFRDWIALAGTILVAFLAGGKFYMDTHTALKLLQQEQVYMKASLSELKASVDEHTSNHK